MAAVLSLGITDNWFHSQIVKRREELSFVLCVVVLVHLNYHVSGVVFDSASHNARVSMFINISF